MTASGVDALLRSPLPFDVVAALIVVEGIALAVWRARTGRGVPTGFLVSFLGAGLALFVALRLLAAGASPLAIVAALGVALVLHLWHLARAWR